MLTSVTALKIPCVSKIQSLKTNKKIQYECTRSIILTSVHCSPWPPAQSIAWGCQAEGNLGQVQNILDLTASSFPWSGGGTSQVINF